MATHPKKANVPVASSNRSNIQLNGKHTTTCNMMDFTVAKKMELVPGESVNITHQLFTRLEPLAVPTFGDAIVHNRAFFVPFRTVFPAWNDFITDVAHVYPNGNVAHVPNVPYIMNSSFIYLFSNTILHAEGTVTYTNFDFDAVNDKPNVDNFDIVMRLSNNSVLCVILNRMGRRFLRLLHQLGYAFNFDEKAEDFAVSALPLLSVARVYMDWYYPQAYVQDERAQLVNSYFVKDVEDYELSTTEIYNILNVVDVVNYDSDYFTSAWDNPVSPTTGSFSPIVIKDLTLPEVNTISNDEYFNGTPVATYDSLGFSQFADDALHALSDYQKRHQIAGARAIDRYLSRYGIQLDAAKLNRSQYLHEYDTFIQFGDVTATAATETVLGDFAGKGIGLCNSSFDYSADEFGMLFIVTSIVPSIGYYQGMHRENMHLSKLDFFTPEFDCLGVQAMAQTELYLPLNAYEGRDRSLPASPEDPTQRVFGFVPRYGEYKVGYDQITGDYRRGSVNTGKDSWNLLRNVKNWFKEDSDKVHDINFVRGVDSSPYNRIFTYQGEDADFFNIDHQFKIDSSFPAKPLYDTYEFENEDDARKVNMNVNGVKAN